jgi:hypothetical protein
VDPRVGLDDVERRKFLKLRGFELRPLGRPARSQSLYRLRYPGSSDGKQLKINSNTNCSRMLRHISIRRAMLCSNESEESLLKYDLEYDAIIFNLFSPSPQFLIDIFHPPSFEKHAFSERLLELIWVK